MLHKLTTPRALVDDLATDHDALQGACRAVQKVLEQGGLK